MCKPPRGFGGPLLSPRCSGAPRRGDRWRHGPGANVLTEPGGTCWTRRTRPHLLYATGGQRRGEMLVARPETALFSLAANNRARWHKNETVSCEVPTGHGKGRAATGQHADPDIRCCLPRCRGASMGGGRQGRGTWGGRSGGSEERAGWDAHGRTSRVPPKGDNRERGAGRTSGDGTIFPAVNYRTGWHKNGTASCTVPYFLRVTFRFLCT